MTVDGEALTVAVSQCFAVALYLNLGIRLGGRPVPPSSKFPARQFSLFWIGLAVSASIAGVLSFIAAFGTVPIGLETGLLYANLVIVSVALWGFVTYIAYLYTGRSGLLPLTAVYALQVLLLVRFVAVRGIVAVSTANGAVNPVYGAAGTGLLDVIALLLLVVPPFLAALLYFRLAFRTRDGTIRYRVTLASWGLFAYFLLAFGFVPPIGPGVLGVLIQRGLLLLSLVVIFLAYYPPLAVRENLGVRSIDEALVLRDPPATRRGEGELSSE